VNAADPTFATIVMEAVLFGFLLCLMTIGVACGLTVGPRRERTRACDRREVSPLWDAIDGVPGAKKRKGKA
jgi:hypothetical protein